MQSVPRSRWTLELAIATLLLVAGAATSPNVASAQPPRRPNIVLLLSDDQTIGAAGCYGNPEIHTPHLDRLAADGVRFTNYYNTTSICMASRCSILTGLYEYRHGCNFDHGNLDRALFEQSYAARLRRAGYFTGFAGKIGFVFEGEPFDALAGEFDRWAGGPGQTSYVTSENEGIARYAEQYPHCSRAYGAWAQDFFRAARDHGQPFCLSISFKAPHLPFTPDPLDVPRYAGRTFPRPDNYGVERGRHLSAQLATSRAANDYREWITDYDRHLASYYALITGVDAALGMIRSELEQLGLAQNTVIIFTSDNGYNCGAHGLGDKVVPYEEGSKSPLVIYDPRLPQRHAGGVCAAVTGNVDMAATIFHLADVAPPTEIDGMSLVPLLTNTGAQVRPWLPLFNFWGVATAQSMAIATPQWKYIYWYYGGQGMRPTEELFDLTHDRGEMQNLAQRSSAADALEAMRAAYDIELRHLSTRAYPGKGYPRYAELFDRTLAWDRKAPLVPAAGGTPGRATRRQGSPAEGTPRRRARQP